MLPLIAGVRNGPRRARARGFSLTEVLVALVVCGIGLLGLAKMESLALSSTDVAGTRSIAALEAASLAAMMRADRAYWAGDVSALGTTSISGGSSTAWPTVSGNATLSQNPPANLCAGLAAASCTPAQLATLDVNRWGRDLGAWLPAGYSANVTCALNPPSTTAVTCEIVLNWAENAVGVNSQQSGVTGASAAFTTTQSPQYTLTVEP